MAKKTLAAVAGLAFLVAAAAPAVAAVQPQRRDLEEFRDPRIDIGTSYEQFTRLDAAQAGDRTYDLELLGVAPEHAFLDLRSERWATLILAHPLIPGSGTGNTLGWEALGGSPPRDEAALAAAVRDAFTTFLGDHGRELGIDVAEVVSPVHVTVHRDGDLIQIYAQRAHQGVRIRDAKITAVVSHGNLVLLGADRWGDVDLSPAPRVSPVEALDALAAHLGRDVGGARKAPYLEVLPLAAGKSADEFAPGRGYDYRLVWVLTPRVAGDRGRWEGLVDAHSGEVLAFRDLNHYGTATRRRVQGGVYPTSNDGVPPDGIEQPGWPMPWADVTVGGQTSFTDGGGNLGFCAEGTITTHLSGLFMHMADVCGAINESSTGNIDLGTSGGDDCVVPAGHSAGDTHASRSGFFEINQAKAQARGQLPDNVWLRDRLTANMNINQSCNAFWDGSTVNFYRSGGNCANTGELAGVFDHEWGHGMDNNDAVPTISNPGEGVADIYAALRLSQSCIGRGFFIAGNCGGYGDPCTQCDGIREIDWAKHVSGQPHDVTWGLANCGGGSHCLGHIYSETVWDLITRDFPTTYGFDHNTSLELATRLTYLGGGNVTNWFTTSGNCQNTTGCGCNADGGYLNFLAVDDDDGNLANGTPHMEALFDAFSRHEIACTAPAPQDGGCASTPPAPTLGVTALDKGARLLFQGSGTESRFDVYRTDGVLGCTQGKVKVGSVPGLNPLGDTFEFIDSGLQNGRQYHYMLVAVGDDDACTSEASTCVAVTPADGPNVTIDAGGATATVNLGDDDPFVDNCEEATLNFGVSHIGVGTQHNVRIVDVEPLSHPSTIVTTPLPLVIAGTLPACGSTVGHFSFQLRDAAFDDTVEFRVGVTSDELAPVVQRAVMRVPLAEGDLEFNASRTFDFETDAEGWEVIAGTFARSNTGGGGNGTTWYEQSSSFVDLQCDQIRSPAIVLHANSTMSLYNNYDIEPFSGQVWYDRANIGVFDVATGQRTAVSPDGGQLYDASGANGTCGTANQPGWAGSHPVWAQSTWSSGALQSATFAGKVTQLHVYYGTDPLLSGFGLRFDEVTLTNFDMQVPDGQSDTCETPVFLFADDFESGDISAWSTSVL